MLGHDQPVILQLLEITPALGALEGVAMELDDCAFPLLAGVRTDDPELAFEDADFALLVGAMPRKAGMERSDLLSANGASSAPGPGPHGGRPRRQGPGGGKPGEHQRSDRYENAPDSTGEVHRHDTAGSQPGDRQLAARVGGRSLSVKKMTIWGNHSSTQYPDLFHCEVDGKPASWWTRPGSRTRSSRLWRVGGRRLSRPGVPRRPVGGQRRYRPHSYWVLGTPAGDWVSLGCRPTAPTGCPRAWCRASRSRASDGSYEIVQGIELDDFSRDKIDASVAELASERDTVKELNLI